MTIIDGTPATPGTQLQVYIDVALLLGLSEFDGTIFITTADLFLARAGECDPSLLVEPAYSILRAYLAAHFYSISNPTESSRSVNGASKSYSVPSPGDGLKLTPFGRAALLLDPKGCLYRTTGIPANLIWMGTAGDSRRDPQRSPRT